MTPEQIAELERLEREATPGPWRWVSPDAYGYGSITNGVGGIEFRHRSNGPFLAAARNALPSLLQSARDLAALRAKVKALATRLRSFPEPQAKTYLRGRYDASIALADNLAALLPGGDASATCSCGHSGTSHLPKCACGCGRVR